VTLYPFSPAFRGELADRSRGFPRLALNDPHLKRAAVVLALVPAEDDAGECALLLTQRAAGLRAHAGQWALPGGRCDDGESAQATAARELGEELGLALAPADILGNLDDYPTHSGYAITPVVAWLDDLTAIAPSPHEVASVHRLRLDLIEAEGAVAFETIAESPRPVIRLTFGEHAIHAPTAALIYQLRELAAGRITRVAHLEQPRFAWR
jgi:8-oxo-dGTP pyrophosphatase MutT (NUDIX family)